MLRLNEAQAVSRRLYSTWKPSRRPRQQQRCILLCGSECWPITKKGFTEYATSSIQTSVQRLSCTKEPFAETSQHFRLFQKNICENRRWCWTRTPQSPLWFNLNVFCRVGARTLLHQTDSWTWTLLCAVVCSHTGTRRGHPQTIHTKMGSWNCPKYLGVLKH